MATSGDFLGACHHPGWCRVVGAGPQVGCAPPPHPSRHQWALVRGGSASTVHSGIRRASGSRGDPCPASGFGDGDPGSRARCCKPPPHPVLVWGAPRAARPSCHCQSSQVPAALSCQGGGNEPWLPSLSAGTAPGWPSPGVTVPSWGSTSPALPSLAAAIPEHTAPPGSLCPTAPPCPRYSWRVLCCSWAGGADRTPWPCQ